MNRGAKPPLKPAYLIVGDNLPKIELALQRLKARIIEDSGTELNVDEFQAPASFASEVVNAANTLAFLSGTRLVLVMGVETWNKSQKETIGRYLSSPAPDACLALVAVSLPPNDLLRTAVAKVGDVLDYPAPREGQLPQWLVEEAARMGARLGLPEAKMLLERSGDNQSLLLRELEKLTDYAYGRSITGEDIHTLATRTVEASMFDLLDNLALGQGAAAFAAAGDLLSSGERPEVLFYRILRHFQVMSKVAALRDEGATTESIQGELKLKPYPARKLSQQAAVLGSEGIGSRLSVLAETDARMKGMGTLPDEMELQLCLGRLLRD
jgi:DNA polymerase III subunit delta